MTPHLERRPKETQLGLSSVGRALGFGSRGWCHPYSLVDPLLLSPSSTLSPPWKTAPLPGGIAYRHWQWHILFGALKPRTSAPYFLGTVNVLYGIFTTSTASGIQVSVHRHWQLQDQVQESWNLRNSYFPYMGHFKSYINYSEPITSFSFSNVSQEKVINSILLLWLLVDSMALNLD